MSLTKQLWIAIFIVTLFAFGGSLIVSTFAARHYLEQQLYVKNIDNATSLALSLSQMPKDPVTIELQISSQFDAGHYRLIRLDSPDGKPVIVRAFQNTSPDVPEWFIQLFPINVAPGVAQVQDGWHLYGTLTLESHTYYVYKALWQATLQLLLWFCVGGLLSGIIGTWSIKRITKPLDQVVEQADAISKRRFIAIPEPETKEFRSVVRAMNALSEHIKNILYKESKRLEELLRQTQHDPVTGLLNRDQFLKQLDSALTREDADAGGSLLLGKITNLTQLNLQRGHLAVDQLLGDIGKQLNTLFEPSELWCTARLNGSDFALLFMGNDDTTKLAETLSQKLQALLQQWEKPNVTAPILLIVGSHFQAHENRSHLLGRIDGALATAEHHSGEKPFVIISPEQENNIHTRDEWRQAITTALQTGSIKIHPYPVLSAQGALLHFEAPVRLIIDKQWHNAGHFMPWAARTGLISKIDAAVVSAALAHIASTQEALAIHISHYSLCDPSFRSELLSHLYKGASNTAKFGLEFSEISVLHHFDEFQALCLALRPLECSIGIEHIGRQFGRIDNLHELGLDYLKIDASLIRDINMDDSNQSFLRGLCVLAHTIGLKIIAEGVNNDKERAALIALGFDGMTGPDTTAWHEKNGSVK